MSNLSPIENKFRKADGKGLGWILFTQSCEEFLRMGHLGEESGV